MLQDFSDLIPASRAGAVGAALLQAFGHAAVTDLSLLAGGLSTAAVYKIMVGGKPYVLKLDGLPPAGGRVGASGYRALVAAAAAGIAPALYYVNEAERVTISEFIDNKPVRAVFAPERLIGELAGAVQLIHRVIVDGSVEHSGGGDLAGGADMRETIEGLMAQFRLSGILSGPVVEECFRLYALIKDQYPWEDTDRVFSHNDLNPGNILCDGVRIRIIDWDTAFMNDRYVDLANVANFFIHTEVQESAYLSAYFDEAVDDHKKARFYLMRQVCRIIYSMLMFQLAAKGAPAGTTHEQSMEGMTMQAFGALMGSGKISLSTSEGQFIFGKVLMNEAVLQMRAPRFAVSLALMKGATGGGN